MSQPTGFLAQRLEWRFPATDTHHGIPLSNGTFGALVWGEGGDLRITINRADYWDHRGGVAWGEEATFQNLKHWLETGNDAQLREVFEGKTISAPGVPPRPTRLPMGRVDLKLPEGLRLATGGLDLGVAEAKLELAPGGAVRACIPREQPVLALCLRGAEAEVIPTPVYHEEALQGMRDRGISPAEPFVEGDFCGWVQECPGEPAMCVGVWQARFPGRQEVFVGSVFGATPALAREAARELLQQAAAVGYDRTATQVAAWWRGYWDQTASVSLPSPERELLYYLGLYKLAGLSWPGGPAATLQGPWVEEYCLPPWSADYHFNINVQECYWPAFGANQCQALEPLIKMVKSWEPLLRENARLFTGVADGLQLPHAVDDRGTCMGGFWTGSVDHGSTAWTGQLFWLYYQHTQDRAFLQETAYPFLKGAMRVFEAMLEDDGEHYRLPVSVSPEFGGNQGNAWGANASFQLANIHFLCRALTEASEVLGVDAADRTRWQDIAARLPLAATDSAGQQIHLWEGQPLSESHRHHSHLAGIYPFDIFAADDERWQGIINSSMQHLTLMGMGLWTGWCMPWASILFARRNNGEMADLLLTLFRRLFMGRGLASTHDSVFPGFTLMAGRPRIMQVEAALAAAAAVIEMLLQTRRGVLHLFPAVPGDWDDASFRGLRAEGAFLVTADRAQGRTKCVEVLSEAGARLVLRNPFGGAVRVERSGGEVTTVSGDVLEISTSAGEKLTLTAG